MIACLLLALLLVPQPGCAQSATPEALLLLVPAPKLGPANYTALLGALQGQAGQNVKLRTTVATVDWAALGAAGANRTAAVGVVEAAMKAAVQGAIDQGFQSVGATTLSGRIENLFVLMDGASCAWATDYPMRGAGASVLLGGSLVPQAGLWPSVYEYPRPLLHIWGQLDGDYPPTKAALPAQQAVTAAVQLGPRRMAQHRPISVVEGLNHALLSNAKPGPLDLPSDAPQGPLLVAVARTIVQFVDANHPSSSVDTATLAVSQLLSTTSTAVSLLSPYTEALGRGSTQSMYSSNSDDRGRLIASVAPTLFGYGAEMLPPSFENRPFSAHPGELAAAEELCASAQRRALQSLPAEAQAAVQVMVTVHTSLDTFINSQPTISLFQTTSSGNTTVVHSHVYLYREDLGAAGSATGAPSSPQYWLKLRSAGVVAYALGLDGSGLNDTISGEELNMDALDAALNALPLLVKRTFEARGVPLALAADRNVTAEGKTPLDWIAELPALQWDPAANATLLTAPAYSTTPQNLPPFDRGPGRFVGNHYVKVMGQAWMQEWAMLGGLREFCEKVTEKCQAAET